MRIVSVETELWLSSRDKAVSKFCCIVFAWVLDVRSSDKVRFIGTTAIHVCIFGTDTRPCKQNPYTAFKSMLLKFRNLPRFLNCPRIKPIHTFCLKTIGNIPIKPSKQCTIRNSIGNTPIQPSRPGPDPGTQNYWKYPR